jgi:hypothetical protein
MILRRDWPKVVEFAATGFGSKQLGISPGCSVSPSYLIQSLFVCLQHGLCDTRWLQFARLLTFDSGCFECSFHILFVCGDALQTTHESMFHVFGLFVFVVISI